MSGRVLVAGIGNVFGGDDGFGSEVARRLLGRGGRSGIEVTDFGERSIDLAVALASGFDAAILVDAMTRGGPPGMLYLIEPAMPATSEGPAPAGSHDMDPAAVLRYAATLGPTPPVIRMIGCEPAVVPGPEDSQVGLSDPVARAVEAAAVLAMELAGTFAAEGTP